MPRPNRVALTNKPPSGAAEKIKRWASEAATVKAIARRLGVSLETLNTWMERHPKLRDAMDEGREEEHKMLFDSLCKHLDKSPTAAIFLLKARHGYREGDQSEIANRVSINFTLPGAMTVEQFNKGRVIEHPAKDEE